MVSVTSAVVAMLGVSYYHGVVDAFVPKHSAIFASQSLKMVRTVQLSNVRRGGASWKSFKVQTDLLLVPGVVLAVL